MNIKKIIYSVTLIFCLFFTTTINAQPGFEDDVVDEPAAPIGDWVPLMLMAGTGLAFYYTSKRKASTN